MSNYFSTNLKFLRENKGISQNKLAALVGVNQTTIARWENQEIAPSIDNVEILAKALKVELPDLLTKDLRIGNDHYENFNELDKILFSKAKELSDNDKQFIIDLMNKINKEIDAEQEK